MSQLLIRFYAVLAAFVGLLSMIFFFPSAEGCSDTLACALYACCGLALGGLGVWLFLLKRPARITMVGFSALFAAYFVYEVIHILMTDDTGQGLVGLVLLLPLFAVCVVGLFLLLAPRTAQEFRSAPPRGPGS